MKKIFFCILATFCCINIGFAQWNIVNTGTTQDLYSVDYYSTNDIWIGSYNQFVKTNNGGSNWTVVAPLKDNLNITIQPANMYDIALNSSTNAIATGFYLMGNVEYILNTTNSGVNWNYASSNNSVALPRYLNAVDVYGTNAIAVGNNGRIARSTNSGASWSFISSGTTSLINDVKFISQDTIIAAGTNIILKSVNGGLTWTNVSVLGDFLSVSCDHNTIYASSNFSTSIIKSTDYGNTFTTINVPFTNTGAIYTVNSNTIIAAGNDGIYISTNDGVHWEKYILSGYQTIKMIDCLDPSNAFAVGLGGYAIKTSNLSTSPSIPISQFAIQGGGSNFCLNDSITLINSTAPVAGYSYAWKLNGTTFSTQYNTGVRLLNSGNQTISLEVTNADGTGVKSTAVVVTGHDISSFTYTSTSDTTCTGNIVGFSIPSSQSGTSYQLRNGFTNIGTAQNGNGGTLNFSSVTGVTSSTSFNIKATRTNACFTDSLVNFKTIYVAAPIAGMPSACPTNSNLCTTEGITNVTFGTINNTTNTLYKNYFDYTCCMNTNVTVGNSYPVSVTVANGGGVGEYVKIWIDLNNNGLFTSTEEVFTGLANPTITGNITIPSTFLFNQKLRIRISSDEDSWGLAPCSIGGAYCGQTEDYAVTIINSPTAPISNFTYTSSTVCQTTCTFANTSYNANTYLWDFGDGSPTSTLTNPSHVYTTSGTYTASLTATNGFGNNIATQAITITIPQTPIAASCNPPLGVCSSRPYLTQVSQQGGPSFSLSANTHDYTCTNQLYLMEDSTYMFNLYGNGNNNYFLPFIDKNNDGSFTVSEALFYNGQNVQNVGVSGYSPWAYFTTPINAVDSVPLRMRLIMSTSFITSANACNVTCGDYKDFTVFLYPHPLTTLFSTSTPTVCSSGSVTVNFMNNSRGEIAWLWDFGDGTTSTLEAPSHVYNSLGSFTVKLKTWDPNGLVDSLIRTNYITVNQSLPIPALSLAGNVLSTIASATSYQWYRNNVLISGATSSSYTLTQSGTYKLVITNSNGCTTTSADYPYFPLTVNFTTNVTTGCGATTVYLNNSSTNATSYVIDWGDGALLNWNGIGTPLHNYVPGTYSVELKACNSSGTCDSLTRANYITINSAVTTPIVNYAAGVLSSSVSGLTYQWYFNNSIISGATSSTYTPTQDGLYKVTVANGTCSATSSNFSYYPVHVNYYANQTLFCSYDDSTAYFYSTTTNATNYYWEFGDGGASILQNPTHIYAPGTYTVKLKACNTLGCDSLINNNYIKRDTNNLSITIATSDPTSYCEFETISVNMNSNVTTAPNYQWVLNGWTNISGANSSSYSTSVDGDYELVVTNSAGCEFYSNTVSINVDYDCVWPGDADHSYDVTTSDILPIGIHYGETGPSRSSISNNWYSYSSNNWGLQSNSSVDKKHADSNGDGIIDMNDTLAITQNMSSTHNFIPNSNTSRSAPNIYFTSSTTAFQAGDWADVDVMLGSITDPAINIYGLAYDFWFDGSFVEPGTAIFMYNDCWMGTPQTKTISCTNISLATNTAYSGVTRITHSDTTGFGKLGTFRFKVLQNLTNWGMMSIFPNNAFAQNANAQPIPITANSYWELEMSPVATSINNNTNVHWINISPNPYTEVTTINYHLNKTSNVSIEIYSSLGQLIESSDFAEQDAGLYHYKFSAKANGYEAGVYFVKMTIDGVTTTKRIIEMK